MRAKTVKFQNKDGIELRGKLELPLDAKPGHFAIFAHCFTCSKDLKAVQNVALALKQEGIGVLRFDFTGLGQSEGDFSESDFSSNVEDLQAAARFLEKEYRAPSLLIGHSLGGTATIMAAPHIKSVKAVATIAAPCDPEHVLKLLKDDLDTIEEEGQAKVELAGREFLIKKQFVEDLKNHGIRDALEAIKGLSLLIMHSPQDNTVGIINARHIYEDAHHPKSFVSLNGADHLLSNAEDSLYAGSVIASWAARYLPHEEAQKLETDEDVVASLDEGPFLTRILAGDHSLLADEPKKVGGDDLGPSPYELVAAGLGACTAMTIKMYANRKEWKLEEVEVHLSFDSKYIEDCENCDEEERKIGQFKRIIEVKGELDQKQKDRILAIANKCPVHRTLTKGVSVDTEMVEQ